MVKISTNKSKFIPQEYLYQATYKNKYPETIEVGEVDVVLPDIPDEREMKNYNKPIKDQKFFSIPDPDFRSMTTHEIRQFAKAKWHRRLNGEWWIIKGEPYYIPGPALVFFDNWTMQNDKTPDFRMEALELFLFWYNYVEPDPDLFGMYDMKCRRIGDTEKLLFITWERSTRYRYVRGGLQSYTDVEAGKNFTRLAKGNRNMPFYFRPKWSGTDTDSLNFNPPKERQTMKKLREMGMTDQLLKHDFLGSYIDFEATVTGKYDGQQLFTWYLDEIFKIAVHKMNVKKQWSNIRKVLSLNNEAFIYGKALMSSTVEKLENASDDMMTDTLELAEFFWDNSNPHDRDELNRTYSGLARIFRGYEKNAEIDEYGFPKIEEARKRRDAKIKAFSEKGDFESLVDLYRKEPGSPDDALTQTSAACPLFPERCFAQLNRIKQGTDLEGNYIKDYRPEVIEYDLVWSNGVGSKVIPVPKRGGRWHISQMPIRPNHVGSREKMIPNEYGMMETKKLPAPLSGDVYAMGCDPYDADIIVGKGSDGAFAVKRKWNPMEESNELVFDTYGEVTNVSKMRTNKYILDYKYRHKSPYDFYMDVLMTCWFYGVPVMVELDKPGLTAWMRQNGYGGFLKYETRNMLAMSFSRKKARQGTKATTDIVNSYVEKLILYSSKYIEAQQHPRILKSWSRFVKEKRTKYDLSVATGLTELVDDSMTFMQMHHQEELKSATGWKNSPYKRHRKRAR
jgi:hypothetical protein